ncbi:hypothetical protein KOW79_021371 [Hemibagrus wyckioides]|uniref:Cadherin domain-containing protein n=1 Tax=Hemibagrus wyckioides TaxID=337641 RepID=A0A9D3N5N3_9TELE|nr:hypothetical protein KOW79_021371 [Hemibagrus wyckioides]
MESASSVKWAVVICLIQVLCNGHKMFSVHVLDSKVKKHTALVSVEQQEDVDEIMSAQSESTSFLALKRRKREFVIPPIRILENDRGPFPKPIAQMKSSHAKETQMVYRISGVGADQPPVGLFIIDKFTGQMYVSRPLDREEKDKYELQVHAQSATGDIVEPAMVFIVKVLDMNDNNPVFTQNPFIGSVLEASKIGFEFMTVSATDADDPNTGNADIRYSIIGQIPPVPNPNMFAINPITGAIRVNSAGLDSKKYPEYILEIQAADMQGNGLQSRVKAIITVTV